MKIIAMNRTNAKRIFKVALTVFLVALGLKCAYRILRNNTSNFNYDPFFKNKTDYDVLFYGPSHMKDGVFPMQLWNDYGITSYNIAENACYVDANYGMLRLSTKYKKPKVVVLDVVMTHDNRWITQKFRMHTAADAFPPSYAKAKVIKDCFMYIRDDVSFSEFMHPFSLYHSRWNNKDVTFASLFDGSRNRAMGADLMINVAVPDRFFLVGEDECKEADMTWLKKFIAHCKTHDIQPILIVIPYPASKDDQRVYNSVAHLAEENGVPFLNMLRMEIVDFSIDCYDQGSHLNPGGARKVTDYLGRYLANELGIKDRRTENAYSAKWDGWYEDYRDFLKENIEKQTSLKNILMLLSDSNFEAHIKLSDRYKADSVEEALLTQIANTCTVEKKSFKSLGSLDVMVDVLDARTKEMVCSFSFCKDSSENLKLFDREKNDEAIKNARSRYRTTARFDVKNIGKKENSVEIIKNSSKEYFTAPAWYTTDTGKGWNLQCNDQSVDFSFRCVGNGNLEIVIRGPDWKDLRGIRTPMKVALTDFTVNGEKIVSRRKVVWHDAPVKWGKEVTDGELVTVHAEWQSEK